MLIEARIDLKKPNIPLLNRKGFTLVDMHTHTNYSDGFSTIQDSLKTAKKLGIGLAITDHNEIKAALLAQKLKKGMMIIPGIEFHPYEGMHLLAYFYSFNELKEFYEKNVKKYLPKTSDKMGYLNINSVEAIEAAKGYNCVISAAHPFSIGWVGLCKHDGIERLDQKIIKKIDALEVISGSNLKRWDRKAIKLAKKLDTGITAGSDAHSLSQLGSVVTYTRQNDNVESFLDHIRKRSNLVIGKQTRFIRKTEQCKRVLDSKIDPGVRLKTGWSYFKQNKYIRNKRRFINFKNKLKQALQRKD